VDELGAKMTGPVSTGNLGSGKSNVPGSTTEIHGPLLAGTASSAKTQFAIDKVNIYFNREVVKLYLKFMISKFK
jgi:hypothetical protein